MQFQSNHYFAIYHDAINLGITKFLSQELKQIHQSFQSLRMYILYLPTIKVEKYTMKMDVWSKYFESMNRSCQSKTARRISSARGKSSVLFSR